MCIPGWPTGNNPCMSYSVRDDIWTISENREGAIGKGHQASACWSKEENFISGRKSLIPEKPPRRLAVSGRSITLRGMIYLMPFAMC